MNLFSGEQEDEDNDFSELALEMERFLSGKGTEHVNVLISISLQRYRDLQIKVFG